MEDRRESNKITKYHKPLNINIGMIIFGVMFIYIIILGIMYFKTEHLSGYEVKEGALSVNNVYRGIALREEQVFPTQSAGYVYYFASEGTHVACGDLIYAIDSSGTLAQNLYSGTENNAYTNEELGGIKSKIMNYKSTFEETDFSTVYDFSFQLKNEVSKLNHKTMLEAMDNLAGASGINKFYAQKAGTIVFSEDGYETLTPESITMDSFDEEKYVKNQYVSNDLLGNDDTAYKIVTKEDWEIIIPVEKERVQELSDAGYVKVRFLEDQFETWGKVNLYGSDAEHEIQFIGLTFNNSMLNYVTVRFIDIELILEEDRGLKIPNSAIAERNFFLVEKEYMTVGDKGQDGVIRQTFTENNEMTTEFVETTVYNVEDDVYYLDEAALSVGDVLYKIDSQETMTVSKQASLVGVYNINKGYADFKQIIILYQNDEYSIVESNTKYGLNCYDYIALDASTVVDDQFIYE